MNLKLLSQPNRFNPVRMKYIWGILCFLISSQAYSVDFEGELGFGYGVGLPGMIIGEERTFVNHTLLEQKKYNSSFGNGVKMNQGLTWFLNSWFGCTFQLRESFLGTHKFDDKTIDSVYGQSNDRYNYNSRYFSSNAGFKIRNNLNDRYSLEIMIAPGILWTGTIKKEYVFQNSPYSPTETIYKFSPGFSLLPSIAVSRKFSNATRLVMSVEMFYSEPIVFSINDSELPQNSPESINHGGDTYSFVNLSLNIGLEFANKSKRKQ